MDNLTKLKKRTGETDTELLEVLLDDAKNAILSRRFPYSPWPDEVEPCYTDLQYRIALDLYNKQGAEGELIHKENGIDRTWGEKSALLNRIVPHVGSVMKNA